MAISSRRRVLGDERAKAVVLLGAGGAAAQMGSQRGHRSFGVAQHELAVDVDVELLEALVAGGLRSGGAKQPVESVVGFGGRHAVSASSSWPAAVSSLRSLRRASCSVL